MKNLILSLLVGLIVISGCKKSGTPDIDGKTCKILVMSKTYTGSTNPPDFTRFYYDYSGNLTGIRYFYNSGDTDIGPQYFYEGNILRYSIANVKYSHDTIYYFFDESNKLERTIEHDSTDYGLGSTTTDYYYNSAKQVVLKLSRFHFSQGTNIDYFDSTIYSYSGNNVYQYIRFYRSGTGMMNIYSRKFYYDSGKNYFKSMGQPPVSYEFWSENNITEIRSLDNKTIFETFTYSSYNESGYPTEFIDRVNSYYSYPFTFRISYECR